MITIPKDIELLISQRFDAAYRKASIGIKNLTEGAVHDFVNRFRSSPKMATRPYDRVRHIKTPVLEIDISGVYRLLARFENRTLTLLDIGGKRVVSQYSENKYTKDIGSRFDAPAHFYPEDRGDFFVRYPDRKGGYKYLEEISSDWLYFLADEQETMAYEIGLNILEAIEKETSISPIFILGGPGTGKTCILLFLLEQLDRQDHIAKMVMNDDLANYIEASTNLDLERFRTELHEKSLLDILLIDDPNDITNALQLAQKRNPVAIVMAFDPLQLSQSITDTDLNQVIQKSDGQLYTLRECYRQKENVGKATKHVVDKVASSTPFLAKSKIKKYRREREELTRLSNDIEFLNPHGYVEVYPEAEPRDVRYEIQRITSQPHLMWTHCRGLLILREDYGENREEIEALLKNSSLRNDYIYELDLVDVESIKGLEFQHVFLFISSELYDELQNGFKGTGRRVYDDRRKLRIPFSRAKDSLVTFGI